MEEVLEQLVGQLTPLVIAVLLAVTNSEIVDYIKRPIQQKFPELDLWFFVYVSLISGAVIGWFSGINLFAPLVEEELLGRILTAILVGGGASLIYKIFKRPNGG